jgi:ABC-type multidrug transport system fused ATPase/permease subunit
MRKIIALYWHTLAGFRRAAALGCLFIGLSGLLEGTAILVLAPILGQGIAPLRQHPSSVYEFIYTMLHIPHNHRLTYTFCAFILIGLLSASVRLIADWVMLRLYSRIEQSFRTRMGNALFKMSWPQFITLGSGDIGKAIFMEGIRTADGCYAFIQMFGLLLIVLIFIVISLLISVPLTLITFSFGVVASVGYFWGGRRASNYARVLADNTRDIGLRVSEIFHNLKFIRASGNTRAAQEETTRLYAQSQKSTFGSLIYKSYTRWLYESSGIILISGLLAYGFFWSRKPVEWSIVFLAVFYRLAPRIQQVQDAFYTTRIFAPWVADWQTRYKRIMAHADRDQGHETLKPSESIELRDVSYQYPQGSVPAIEHVYLSIAQGRCVALVGESGSGKSTVLDLVTGLLEPSSGEVLVDATPLTRVNLETWRSRIGLVLQGSPLFYGSILKNIAWGDPNPDMDNAVACARMANAWEFIERLPQGILTEVEEKGARFSGGQRQRIALARALYRNPWLLILDEPTSELDADSEDRIFKALQKIKGRYAILITSHRLEMARLADEILVLERGCILERGSWESLSANPAGLFQRLAKQQRMP